MKRRLFTILSVLSLLLFVAVVVLWVRSCSVETDRWWCQFDYGYLSVLSVPGGVIVQVVDYSVDPRRESWAHTWWGGGFGYGQVHLNDSSDYLVRVPFWAVAVLAFFLPACAALSYARGAFKINRGHCPSCGYDLRATPERCPECGAAPAKASA